MTAIKTLAMAGTLAMAATSVSAAEYKFDLEKVTYGGDDAVGYYVDDVRVGYVFTDGDMTMTVTGGAFKDVDVNDGHIDSGTMVDGVVSRHGQGAGVYHADNDGEHTVDGISTYNNYNDYIQLSFAYMGSAVDVMLDSLSFGYIAYGSEFALIGDKNGDGSIGIGDQVLLDEVLATYSPYTFGPAPVGSVFGVAAPPHASWKLHQVHFSYMPPVNEVPLPAAGWMLLAGLGGLVAAKRRKG